jgi:inhibitor of KinA
MIGFLPGFAYMGSVDKRIATARLEKPRTVVPEGSVGIAGEQTGIYPVDSPGGWNIIGRTPVKLFDVNKSEPTLFQPGDKVEFYSITLREFESFNHEKFKPVYEY